VKYSNQKPIQIEFSEVENHLQLIIQDHGKGIPEDELKFISEPFQRGSNVLSTKGSGIGLSLALLILEQNQIGFSIQSKINEGTTIRLKFKT
jgi:two-component system sensor histidine kinase ArlS